MREAYHGALAFPPLQDRKIPGRPVLDPLRIRIILFLQSQKNQVPRMARGEARDLQIVAHQIRGSGQRMIFPLKEPLLKVVARPPGKDAADIQVLAQDMTHHIFREDSLRRLLIVEASGRMNMVISGIPASIRGVDPALQSECETLVLAFIDMDGLSFYQILGAPAVLDHVLSGRKPAGLAVRAVDLRMKGKIGSETLRLRRVNSTEFILQ